MLMVSEGRAVLWVESIVGGGHLQAADQIATALINNGVETHLVTGSHYRSRDLTYGGATVHAYEPRLCIYHSPVLGYVTADNTPLAEARGFFEERSLVFKAKIAELSPNVILTEHWPFGRGNMDGEIASAIDHVKQFRPNTLIYGSVRDVMLVAAGECSGGTPESAARVINHYFDRIFVHSDPQFISFDETFPCAAEIYDKTTYTGYLVHPMPARLTMPDKDRPVLVSSGGGKTGDGIDLYKTAIQCKRLLPQDHPLKDNPWYILVSPAYPHEVIAELRDLAEQENAGVIVQENMNSTAFRKAMSNSALCISLSGYNTVIEAYAADVPAVILPFYNAAQGQLFRANAFAKLGKMVVLPHTERNNAEFLVNLINETLAKQHIIQPVLGLQGAQIVAHTICSDLRNARKACPLSMRAVMPNVPLNFGYQAPTFTAAVPAS